MQITKAQKETRKQTLTHETGKEILDKPTCTDSRKC